jgi:(2R)-ethylmalonyl-CoA mutase
MSQRSKPWVMRTYAGHSSPRESNELYRRNLAKGQTGLSIAFDLPTQTGYDDQRHGYVAVRALCLRRRRAGG